jgi:hypothetical protein
MHAPRRGTRAPDQRLGLCKGLTEGQDGTASSVLRARDGAGRRWRRVQRQARANAAQGPRNHPATHNGPTHVLGAPALGPQVLASAANPHVLSDDLATLIERVEVARNALVQQGADLLLLSPHAGGTSGHL